MHMHVCVCLYVYVCMCIYVYEKTFAHRGQEGVRILRGRGYKKLVLIYTLLCISFAGTFFLAYA